MKIGVLVAVAALGAGSSGAGAATLELAKLSDTVERAGGGDPLGFTLQTPKGAQASAKLMPHVRGYGLDVGSDHISLSLTRLNGELDANYQIRNKASFLGGLESRQELDKDTSLGVLKPLGPRQFVYLYKRLPKGQFIELECSGPPSYIETAKAACASLTIP